MYEYITCIYICIVELETVGAVVVGKSELFD
jgi:hypothetical protein